MVMSMTNRRTKIQDALEDVGALRTSDSYRDRFAAALASVRIVENELPEADSAETPYFLSMAPFHGKPGYADLRLSMAEIDRQDTLHLATRISNWIANALEREDGA